MKKILSNLIVALAVMSLALTVFAAETVKPIAPTDDPAVISSAPAEVQEDDKADKKMTREEIRAAKKRDKDRAKAAKAAAEAKAAKAKTEADAKAINDLYSLFVPMMRWLPY